MKASFLVKSFAGAMAATLFAAPAHAVAPDAKAGASAPATAAVSVKTDVKIERTVTENGQTSVKLVELKNVVPGDKLVYTFRYRNDGTLPATNYVMIDPLSSALVPVPDRVAGADFSVDGGKTWGPLASLKVADGQGGFRTAVAGDATHLRWTIAQIAPGASGQIEFHAIVR